MQEKPDDASLLTAAAGGDRRAFARIYLAYKDDLLTLAAVMLGDRQAAEDVLHDVFVALARRIGKLTLSGPLKGYLLTSCANRARDLLRRRAVRHGTGDVPEIAASGNPARAAEVAEETARAMAALTKLPSEQREVVALHIHGQFTFREVARLLEIPMNTAKSRYRYALSALRKELNHDHR
ncbi:MAG: sigma-70 family RNA polymerase sigma factor [Candidatus Nealsonbacteria bacterium]|nr:sigma-70 family RNA polymerase sigma factor [Candidatus Nealsonbacteria bacterium]